MKRKKHGRRILSCVLAASMAVPAVSGFLSLPMEPPVWFGTLTAYQENVRRMARWRRLEGSS